MKQIGKINNLKHFFRIDLLLDEYIQLDDYTTFDKMDIICETIHARYEIADGQIVIYAKGCK
jgi:hypothetical protein